MCLVVLLVSILEFLFCVDFPFLDLCCGVILFAGWFCGMCFGFGLFGVVCFVFCVGFGGWVLVD